MNKNEIIKKYQINITTLNNWVKTGLEIDINSNNIKVEVVDKFISDNDKLNNRNNKTKVKTKTIPKELTKILDISMLKENIKAIDNYLSLYSEEEVIDSIIYKRIIDIKQNKFKNIKYISLIESHLTNLNNINEISESMILENNNYLLGVLIQYTMGVKDQSNFGSYYTPIDVIQKIIPKDIKNKTFLEPCSGSGYILFELFKQIKKESNENPLNFIYGNDINEKAVIGSIIELIEMAKNEVDFIFPKVYNKDGLDLDIEKVDYVITNPPYGSKIVNEELKEILDTKESFSFFIYKSLYSYLKNDGKLFLVLPDSILKVKTHLNIRTHILNNGLFKVDFLGKCFKGVMSDIVLLYIDKTIDNKEILYKEKEKEFIVMKDIVENNLYSIINKYKTKENNNKINELFKKKHYLLNETYFYLGIVTGNNKNKIKSIKTSKYNKEVIQGKNFNKKGNFYISLEDQFQQSPDLKIFERNKIIYKFISSTIQTKVDSKNRYTINSVNVYSPEDSSIEELNHISNELNSKTSDFILKFYFGDIVKVLKEHLCILPIFEKE